jgi:hypothetical protein
MPEPDGSLDPQERERFDAWLAQHWHNPDCPVCGAKDWSRGGKVHQIVNQATFSTPDGTSLPAVSLACEVCGYTMFVNAIKAGIVELVPLDAEELVQGEVVE